MKAMRYGRNAAKLQQVVSSYRFIKVLVYSQYNQAGLGTADTYVLFINVDSIISNTGTSIKILMVWIDTSINNVYVNATAIPCQTSIINYH